jgi:hypothetical protein
MKRLIVYLSIVLLVAGCSKKTETVIVALPAGFNATPTIIGDDDLIAVSNQMQLIQLRADIHDKSALDGTDEALGNIIATNAAEAGTRVTTAIDEIERSEIAAAIAKDDRLRHVRLLLNQQSKFEGDLSQLMMERRIQLVKELQQRAEAAAFEAREKMDRLGVSPASQ